MNIARYGELGYRGESSQRRHFLRQLRKLERAREIIGDAMRNAYGDEEHYRSCLQRADDALASAIGWLEPQQPTEEGE